MSLKWNRILYVPLHEWMGDFPRGFTVCVAYLFFLCTFLIFLFFIFYLFIYLFIYLYCIFNQVSILRQREDSIWARIWHQNSFLGISVWESKFRKSFDVRLFHSGKNVIYDLISSIFSTIRIFRHTWDFIWIKTAVKSKLYVLPLKWAISI